VTTTWAPNPDLSVHAEVITGPPLSLLKLDIVCACLKFHIPQEKAHEAAVSPFDKNIVG